MKPPSPSTAGELLMLRLVGPRWSSSLEQQLQALEPGGVLLAGPLPRSPETLHELLGGISRSLPAPPILALEAEVEGADPLSALLPSLPPPRALAQKGARFFRNAGELMGEALKLLEFNTYFALTLDLAPWFAGVAPGFSPARASGVAPGFSPAPAALSIKSGQVPDGATFKPPQHPSTFSADPRVVAECGSSFVEGLTRHKILACAKHFPGRASVPPARDELSISGRSMAELWRSDLVPYRELLPRLPLVLMSAAAYKAYDFDYPQSAALSAQVVAGLLRAKLGYRGVVVAPQLESQPVRGVLDMGRAAVQSLSAGCDMLLVEKDESWQAMRRGIEEALASGELTRERLEQSLAGIRRVKRGLTPPSPFSQVSWERLAERFEKFTSAAAH